MNRIYRSATVIVGLAATVIGLVAAAPAAFAMRLVEPGESAPYPTPVTVVHSGAPTWEVVIIAALCAVVASVATAIGVRYRRQTTTLPRSAN
jgi:hypothetical protein